MTDWRSPSRRALFVSEIATISLLGRREDVDRLEELLENSTTEELQRELIRLADAIRSRHDMGLRRDCCTECLRYESCELKWLKVERNMRPTCCPRCQGFARCLASHRQAVAERRRQGDLPEPDPSSDTH